MQKEIGPLDSWDPDEARLWKQLGFEMSQGGDQPEESIKRFQKSLRALRTKKYFGLAVRRLLKEFERTDADVDGFDLSAKKLKAGEQLPSFSHMTHMAQHGIDIPYVLLGVRLIPQADLDRLGEGVPFYTDSFADQLMAYGGGRYNKVSEQQRLGFCNWLLMEFLEECPYRNDFIRHFSANGNLERRKEIARVLARDTYISMADLVDAVFQCTTDPERLANYAGADGCK